MIKTIVIIFLVLGAIFWAFMALRKKNANARRCIYSEVEMAPRLWAHNDAIAAIGVYEASDSKKTSDECEDPWGIADVKRGRSDDGQTTIIEVHTKNGRKWVYELYNENTWVWLINLPLLRFLNDNSYRKMVESVVSSGNATAEQELLVSCCLLHAHGYHAQFDAESLLISSAQKGNVNAKFELACLYYGKEEYGKACSLNQEIKEMRGSGIWFIERLMEANTVRSEETIRLTAEEN